MKLFGRIVDNIVGPKKLIGRPKVSLPDNLVKLTDPSIK